MRIVVTQRPKHRVEVKITNGLDTQIYFATNEDGMTVVCEKTIEDGQEELVLLLVEKYLNP